MDKDRSSPNEPTKVTKPVTVAVTDQTDRTIRISWGYLNGLRQATRFKWEQAGQPVGQHDVPKEGSFFHTIEGLEPNTEYLIKAFGLVGEEESPGSTDVKGTTKSESSST